MNLQIFVVFHNKIFEEIYNITNEEQKYITFYGVKNRYISNMDVVYENELKLYNPILQQKSYNEASCIYHVYINNLYSRYDYIGFAQYDMKFNSNIFNKISQLISPNTIFCIGFFDKAFLGGQTSIIRNYNNVEAGLKNYNTHFNTNYVESDLINNKMIFANTFIIHKKMYKKMMSWLIEYFINDIDINMHDITNDCHFNPGHLIEALIGLFLSLEVAQGAKYELLDLTHDHFYKN
jgi:hypothetical protein